MIEIDARKFIHSLVFFHDGEYLLSGGVESMIRQWRIRDGTEVGEGMKTGSAVATIDFSGDGKWIVTSGKKVANVWSTMSRQITLTVCEHSDWVDTVHVSPDSTRFATGSDDKRAFIWDISTGQRLVGPLEHGDRVGVVRFSPDGSLVVTGTVNKCLRVYDAHSGELLKSFPISVTSYPSNLVAWPNSQSIFALISGNILVHIDVNTGEISSSQIIPGDPANHYRLTYGSIVLSRNGRFIVSFVGNVVSLWNPFTLSRISADIKWRAGVSSIALSSDSRRLAIGDADNKVTLHCVDGIVPDYYLDDQHVIPRPWSVHELQSQIEALQGQVRALGLRPDEPNGAPLQPNDPVDAGHDIRAEAAGRAFGEPHSGPLGIGDGTYRIKSNTNGLYLACSQDRSCAAVVQQLDERSIFQRWIVSLIVDGTYTIVCRTGDSKLLLSVANANALVCVSSGRHITWTIEPRGDTCVIGNSGDATAIHLSKGVHGGVSVSVRNNSRNQRWVFERVTD